MVNESKRVSSNTLPQQVERIQGKVLVNFDVVESIGEDNETKYTYEQVALQKDAPQELVDKEIASRTPALVKARLVATLAGLTVTTTNGNTFDANLESRGNMADAILASGILGITENIWRLADNTEVLVNITELREAHALALQAYARTKAIGA